MRTAFLRSAFICMLPALAVSAHAQSITAYRYWFDDDVTTIVTNPVAGGLDYTLTADAASAALALGYSHITVQVRDDQDAWSVPITSTFARMGGDQTEWEYWLDDDVSTLVNNTVGNTALVNVISQIDLSALPTGSHTITLRTRDGLDGYSVPLTQAFDVVTGIAELPGVQHALLMPDPAEDLLTLRLDATGDQSLRVDVMDAVGRVVLLPMQYTFSGTMVRTMDVSGLATGSYQLRITGATGATAMPFIKR